MIRFSITKLDGTTYEAVVSDEDADLAKRRWSLAGGKKGAGGKYLASSRGSRTTIYLHRVVATRMGLLTEDGLAADGRSLPSVDHINGNKLDNRRENLRLLTRQQQMFNPNDRLRRTNRSGFRGVSFVAGRERFGKPWMAYVQVEGKSKNLGWYATAEEAAAARKAWDDDNPRIVRN